LTIHNSPRIERFYRLNTTLQRPIIQQPSFPTHATHSKDLTRDEKIEIRTLRKHNNWSYITIAKATGKTARQVQGAFRGPPTPHRRQSGRKPVLRTPEKNRLQQLLLSDPLYRRLPFSDLQDYLPGFETYGEHAIRTALRALGYHRTGKGLFSDETWATNLHMWKQWITIHHTEDPEAWALLRQKPHGWMFWSSFAGCVKGPGFI
ncbi:hypothetical protein B0T25DRAFT_540878, partial [Lasiosphaeria hispida]